jgi:hypothetical protein
MNRLWVVGVIQHAAKGHSAHMKRTANSPSTNLGQRVPQKRNGESNNFCLEKRENMTKHEKTNKTPRPAEWIMRALATNRRQVWEFDKSSRDKWEVVGADRLWNGIARECQVFKVPATRKIESKNQTTY